MIKEIRCSSLHRPMNCIGFLSIENLFEEEAGMPAKEGTAIGELLSEMIRQKTPSPSFPINASNGVFIDQDMWFYATATYEDILRNAQGSLIETEERIDWQTQAGVTIRGQFDISYVIGDVLCIEDLKYGWGIVDVKENWQLIGYAIGQCYRIYQTYNWLPKSIRFKIHQPRPYHPDGRIRPWEISFEELMKYKDQIEQRMLAYVNGDRTLQTTQKSCKYCPGATSCPALHRSVYKSVETAMDDWSDRQMTNEEIAFELDLLKRAEELIELKYKSLDQLATHRINAGQIIPGYALDSELGDRKWRNDITVEAIKMLTGKDITEVKMLSPNKAEQMGVPRALVKNLTERAQKGTKLIKKDVTDQAKKILPKPY